MSRKIRTIISAMNRSDVLIRPVFVTEHIKVSPESVPATSHAATLSPDSPNWPAAVVTRMPTSDVPDDLPDRIVRVLDDTDEPVSVGRIQRLLARDGIDVAERAIRDTCDALADDGRLVKELGPRYGPADERG